MATLDSNRPTFGRVAVRYALALILVLYSWPGLGRLFTELLSGVMNVAASQFVPSGGFLELRPEGPPDSWNAVLTLGNTANVQQLLWDVKRTPYLPMAVFVALTLAFPSGRLRRRLLILGVGLGCLSLLPALRLLSLLSADTPFRLLELSSTLQSVLLMACAALVFPPSMAYALPLLLWLFLLSRFDPPAFVALTRSVMMWISAGPSTAPSLAPNDAESFSPRRPASVAGSRPQNKRKQRRRPRR